MSEQEAVTRETDAGDDEENASAAVIAGGHGRRMGGDKRGLLVDGVPMLRRVILAVTGAAPDDVIVVCRSDDPPDPAVMTGLRVRLAYDRFADAGPLAGVEAGLRAARRDLVCVVAGDLPWLEPAVLRLLLAEARAHREAGVVALATERGPEPLIAVYSRSLALPTAARLLDAGTRRVHALLDALPVHTLGRERWVLLDPSAGSERNVNEPSDLNGRGSTPAGSPAGPSDGRP